MKIAKLLVGLMLTGNSYAKSVDITPVLNDHQRINYGSSISPDGKYMYYSDRGADFSVRHIMRAELHQGKATNFQKVLFGGVEIAGGDTQISPDGETLLFYTREDIERPETRQDGDLYYAVKTKDGWSQARRFPDTINSELNEFYPVMTRSKNVYFARENTETSYDLYVSEYVNGEYKEAKRLNNKINTQLLESDAYISPDESFMVFVRMNEEGAYGVSDLYLSFQSGGDWQEPINLGALVNFEGVDGSPFVTQDKRWLYFTSNRDAPEPTKFDSYLGVFRIPFEQMFHDLNSAKSQLVYQPVESLTTYYEQGKTIFNTSMPNDGSSHFFTDSGGFDWGPTALYQRQYGEAAKLIEMIGAKVPADVHISPEGKTLYYVDYGEQPSRIYRSQWKKGKWQKPVLDQRFPPGSGYLTSTDDGVFYFAYESDIYRLEDDELTRLPDAVNSADGEFDPFIAQDESFLIWVRQDGDGDSNMYISFHIDQVWTSAQKLPTPLNSEKVDGSPYVTPDKQYLFFSSNRDGEVLKTWQSPFAAALESLKRTL